MLSLSKTKLLRALLSKKQREQHQLFRVEGSNNVRDFMQSTLPLVEIFASDNWINQYVTKKEQNKTSKITEGEMKKITALTTPSEVLAIFELPHFRMLESNQISQLTLMLDDIKDPGNLGTIIRTADWFGIQNIVCSKETTDAFSPKVVQATMGSLARVNLQYTDLTSYLNATNSELPIYGALLNGTPLNQINHQGAGIVIIGSEAHGINPNLFSHITHKVTIPAGSSTSNTQAESLNASIASAIFCYALTEKTNS